MIGERKEKTNKPQTNPKAGGSKGTVIQEAYNHHWGKLGQQLF